MKTNQSVLTKRESFLTRWVLASLITGFCGMFTEPFFDRNNEPISHWLLVSMAILGFISAIIAVIKIKNLPKNNSSEPSATS